ncbi:hypothetical protein [Corallococcus sp. EGB]|uniref:hypothetical protein n=1 Tax=Corallococcus sp. EGB TaxID=1521117 RepID=UPI001CBD2662|nr:hypothetical protein [Corallococcus sp. EGB]
MRRLLAAVPLLALFGCSYVGIGVTPRSRLGTQPAEPVGPVSIRVGKSDSTLAAPETEQTDAPAPAKEATDAPGATQ